MTLSELLQELRTVLSSRSGSELLEAVHEQNQVGSSSCAFGRDITGTHALYLVFPLTNEQIKGLANQDVLLTTSAYEAARNAQRGGKLS